MQDVKRRKTTKRRTRRAPRRNPEISYMNPAPSKWRSRGRRAVRAAKGFLGGSGLGAAIRSLFPMTIGAMAAKVAQRKFGDKSSESDNWTMKDYLMAAVGVGVVGFGSRYLLKVSPATSQKVLEGGLLLIVFKAITNEIAPMNSTMQQWIGDDQAAGQLPADEGSWEGFSVGDLYEDSYGRSFMLAQDGSWQPVDGGNRLLPAYGQEYEMGDSVVSPGQYGDSVVSPGQYGDDFYPSGEGPNF